MRKIWKAKLLDKVIKSYLFLSRKRVETSLNAEALSPKHILIFSTTALGDFLFNTPAIRAVRKRFPDAQITLVVHEKYADFLKEGNDWNKLVFWNNKAITISRVLRSLKGEPPIDIALLLHSHEPYDYLCAILAGSRLILKDNYRDDIALRDKWLADYTIAFKGHVIERKLKLVEGLGCDVSDITMKLPFSVENKTANIHPVIGFQLGASTPERCWAPENFSQLAVLLLKQFQYLTLVLIGGPGDKGRAETFLRLLPANLHARIVNEVGDTSLPQLCRIINNMDLLVTGDTGPLHIAVTLNTPTLGLFVTANPYATGAFQNPDLHHLIYISRKKSHADLAHVMDVIKPERVAETAEFILNKIRAETLPEAKVHE
ncbi:glycosyltransferase family 9 protein [Candidatus Pantoea bituminis]|uniref:glycosyltransferase family 9 protein n=1 Tax=Candidatus Pantoea bituminis TaxID=2831036 RepID=UPI001C062ABB|nr:glycosyltransferase family 9 protein [Pantoea bituminis]